MNVSQLKARLMHQLIGSFESALGSLIRLRGLQRVARAKGFTLLEVMIVVAIIGILAAIAFPSYQDSVWKGKRGEAKAAILRVLQSEERWYTQNNTYVTFSGYPAAAVPGAMPNFSGDSPSKSNYAINAEACTGGAPLSNCVKIVATVIGTPDPKCTDKLSKDSAGTTLPLIAGCW